MFRLRSLQVLFGTILIASIAGMACSSSDDGQETGEGAPGAPAAASGSDEAGAGEATGVGDGEGPDPFKLRQDLDVSIVFTSPVFNAARRIPKKHTCTKLSANEPNISPPLQWEGVPEAAQSLVLVMHSVETPDEEPWVHWLMWYIPPSTTELTEGVTQTDVLPDGTIQGLNSRSAIGYLGPCPPRQVPPNYDTSTRTMGTGKQQPIEKYFFKLFALDGTLDLPAGATKEQLYAAIEGRVIAGGELVGERQGKLILKE